MALFYPNECFQGYVVERLLGEGAIGSVYLVRHKALDKRFALKVLHPQIASEQPEYVKRFVREARIASQIRHPNLVQVHNAGYDDEKGVYFMVMDYVEGCNLRVVIGMNGAIGHREAVRIVASVAGALAAGEPYGVVHRDIKPENIMLEADGTVKLVDLGVAKARGTDSLITMQKTVFGTPNYISPEQAQDSSAVDFRADIYSLGVVLFELLCGKRPYDFDNPKKTLAFLLSPDELPDVRTFNPDVPQKLSLLLKLMCAKDASKRIESASKLLEVLQRFGYGLPASEETQISRDNAEPTPDIDYPKLMSMPANDTLSLETKDAEIADFVQQLKEKKKRRKLAIAVATAMVAIAVLAAIVLLACHLRGA